MTVAFASAKARRGYLGAAAPFTPSLEGRLVTLDGRLDSEAEVVALSRISSVHGASHLRCAEPAKLMVGNSAVLLEGPLTVVVGSCEHRRQVGLGEVVAYRELRSSVQVRGRGRLRRIATDELVGYRGHAFTWALCATGTDDTIDLASTTPPKQSHDEPYWNDLVLYWGRPGEAILASVATRDTAVHEVGHPASPELRDTEAPEIRDPSSSITVLMERRRQRRSR